MTTLINFVPVAVVCAGWITGFRRIILKSLTLRRHNALLREDIVVQISLKQGPIKMQVLWRRHQRTVQKNLNILPQNIGYIVHKMGGGSLNVPSDFFFLRQLRPTIFWPSWSPFVGTYCSDQPPLLQSLI